MATKFKPGDIVKVTKIYPGSAWYNNGDHKHVLDHILKLTKVIYRNGFYFIDTTIIDGPLKDLLMNDNLSISYCKIRRYDKPMS